MTKKITCLWIVTVIASASLGLTSCSNNNVGPGQEFGDERQVSINFLEDQLKNVLAADEKQSGVTSSQVVNDLLKLGDLYRRSGKLADSEAALRRSVDIYKLQGDTASLLLAKSMNSYGMTLVAEHNFKQAETMLQDALAMRESHKDEPLAIAESQGSLGQLYFEGGILPEAKQWFEKSFATVKSSGLTSTTQFAEGQNNLASVCFAEGKYEEAEQMLQSALSTYENVLGHDKPEVSSCLNNLGQVYVAEGKLADAEAKFEEAIDIYQKISALQHPNLAACLTNLALCYQKQQMYDKAEPLYKKALALEESEDAVGQSDMNYTLKGYAKLLHSTDREAEAKVIEARSNTSIASH